MNYDTNHEKRSSLMQYIQEGFYVMLPQSPIKISTEIDLQIELIYQCKVVDCNKKMATMYGYSKKDNLIGMTLADLHGSSDNPENIAFLKEWVRSDYVINGFVSEEQDKNGNMIWFTNNVIGIVEDGYLTEVYGIQSDITKFMETSNKLKKSERNLKSVLDGMMTHICIIGFDGKILEINNAFELLLEYSREELIGESLLMIEHELSEEMYKELINLHIENPDILRNYEAIHTSKSGKTYPVLQHASVIEYNEQKSILISSRDISTLKVYEEKLEKANEKLELLATTDTLTGLFNRRKMQERLEHEIIRCKRTKDPFTVVLADIDYFKEVNDQYGHDCGDYILMQVAELMKKQIRGQDTLCRWGGEEFMLLLPQTNINGARHLIEKIRKLISEHDYIYNNEKSSSNNNLWY